MMTGFIWSKWPKARLSVEFPDSSLGVSETYGLVSACVKIVYH